jgi:hypothetical protein
MTGLIRTGLRDAIIQWPRMGKFAFKGVKLQPIWDQFIFREKQNRRLDD